jgi:hypothetical protein
MKVGKWPYCSHISTHILETVLSRWGVASRFQYSKSELELRCKM